MLMMRIHNGTPPDYSGGEAYSEATLQLLHTEDPCSNSTVELHYTQPWEYWAPNLTFSKKYLRASNVIQYIQS